MKNLRYIGAVMLAGFGLLAVGCDTIEDDNYKKPYNGGISSERKVLLEDYTGVRCVNCPTAAAEIERLQEFYGDNIIVVGVYPMQPTGLTQPWDPNRDLRSSVAQTWATEFATGLTQPWDPNRDLRSSVAQTWATEFAIEQFPNGMVNRQEVIGYQEWGGAIAEVISGGINYVDLSLTANMSTDSTIAVSVEGSFVENYEADGAVNLITMILEDSIVAPQTTPTGVNGNYVHNHVLRAVLGPEWGSQVASEAPTRGTTFSTSLSGTVDKAWRTNKLSVVAAVVNANSREVIQVEIVHLGDE